MGHSLNDYVIQKIDMEIQKVKTHEVVRVYLLTNDPI